MATKAKSKAKTKAKPKQTRQSEPRRGSAARVKKADKGDGDGGELGADELAAPDASTRDPRIPAIGQTIRKLDRHGRVRCECEVVESGFEYQGTVYPSLSAAAMAAAKILKLTNKTQNGFAFWGLGRPADLLTTLEQTWRRYETKAATLVKRVTDETRSTVAAALRHHSQTLEQLVEGVS